MSKALNTDKYEFTMLEATLKTGVAHRKAVFELFNRRLQAGRSYGIVAGIERVLDAVENFKLSDEDLEFLSDHLSPETIDYLRDFKFTGTIRGYQEGDYFFPFSPVIQLEGTFGECVIFETVMLSIMNYDSAVATAASVIRRLDLNTKMQELGARRVNEEASVVASRSAYLAGWDGTSNLMAGRRYGVPVFGTSAHAFTLAHETESEAFTAQIDALGVGTTLLVDTYDIFQGVKNAIDVAGVELGAVRIDSEDPVVIIPQVRELLDSLGAVNTKIIFSGDLDKETISRIVKTKTPCDGYGIGSSVVTGDGFPNCGFVFKLVEMEYSDGEMHHVAKKASGKGSIGGRKTVSREFDENGYIIAENLSTNDEIVGVPVQVVYVENGEFVFRPTLEDARKLHFEQMNHFGSEVEVFFI